MKTNGITIPISIQEYQELKSLVIENNSMLKKLTAVTEKELLTPKEVCEILKISRDTFQRYADKKLFALVKLDGKGSGVRVERAKIEKLIEAGKV